MRQIDQRVVGPVVDARHKQVLPNEGQAGTEDFLSLFRQFDGVDGYRSGLAAGDGVVRWILEPVAVLQAVDDAAIEIGDVTRNPADLRVAYRVDLDVVAKPVDPTSPTVWA